MIINPNGQPLRGGIPLSRVPVIPWDAFVACGLRVFYENKVQMVTFEPQPIEAPDEAVQLLRLILAAQSPKPGPVAWDTVPEAVRRHFQAVSDNA